MIPLCCYIYNAAFGFEAAPCERVASFDVTTRRDDGDPWIGSYVGEAPACDDHVGRVLKNILDEEPGQIFWWVTPIR